MVADAFKFARKKHAGQERKFEKTVKGKSKKYVSHPVRVARIVREFKGKSKNINKLLAAALLHDTVEDTDTTVTEIEKKFGKMVGSIVHELTSDKNQIEKEGKTEYLAKKMSENLTNYALVLKLADRLDNVRGFNMAPEKFVNKYRKETANILIALDKVRKLTSTQKELVKEIWKHVEK